MSGAVERSRFATVRSLDPGNPATWQDKMLLLLDIDWASDDVLSDTISLLERAEVPATWFVTHDTPVLQRLRANPRFELGLHPNFNDLLAGHPPRNGASAHEIVSRLMRLVPEAVSVHSHSMTQSSRLLDIFKEAGLRYDCNHFIPAECGFRLAPWPHWNGLIRVPVFWEDDVHFGCGSAQTMAALRQAPGLKAFCFHPLHIALNTHSAAQYEAAKAAGNDWGKLQDFVQRGPGVRTWLSELIG